VAHHQHTHQSPDKSKLIDHLAGTAAQPAARRIYVIQRRRYDVRSEQAVGRGEKAGGGYEEDYDLEAVIVHDLGDLPFSLADILF
jgi:hypothetical protein